MIFLRLCRNIIFYRFPFVVLVLEVQTNKDDECLGADPKYLSSKEGIKIKLGLTKLERLVQYCKNKLTPRCSQILSGR